MAFQKQNYFQRRTKPRGPRTNDRIRAPEVQVISSDKKNLGTLSTKAAIEMATTGRFGLNRNFSKRSPSSLQDN